MAYDIFSEFYDRLTDNVEYETRAEYFCRLLSMCGQNDGILLDLACGTGSMSVEMAKRGFDVIGVDSSVGMLNRAREKAYGAGENILLLCQDMCEIDLYGTVRSCICVLDSINHLPDAKSVKAAFKGVSLFMESGGAFAFDVNTLHKHRDVLADNAFTFDLGDVFCAWQNEYDADSAGVDITLDFFKETGDGLWDRYTEQFSEQYYSIEGILSWLSDCGFETVGVFDDMTTEPVTENSQRAVFLAKKI